MDFWVSWVSSWLEDNQHSLRMPWTFCGENAFLPFQHHILADEVDARTIYSSS